MIYQISVVTMNAESGNLMEIMLSDVEKCSTNHTIPIPWTIYINEYNHCTCLVYPQKASDK